MNKLLLIGMVCYGLTAGAQVRQNENFVYLYSDSVIYANRITLRPDLFNSLQLRADSRRIPLQQVKFFNNADGFFANTRKQTFVSNAEFAERIVEGRINLFQEVSYEPYLNDYNYRSRYRRSETVDLRMYYNKGFDDLKKVNYNNLKSDMANNPESMDFLKNYRKSINTSTALYVSAGAAIVAGLITFLVTGNDSQKFTGNTGFPGPNFSPEPFKSPNYTASYVLMGLGVGLATGGYVVNAGGSRHLENAVDAYNR